MSQLPLLATAFTAAAPVARQLGERLVDGLSFAATLGERIASSASHSQAGSEADVRPDSTAAAAWSSAHRFAQRRLEDFLAEFRQLAGQQQLTGSTGVRLKSDGRDGVVVDGNHPQRAEIEGLFELSPELREKFQLVAAAQTTAYQLGQPGEKLRGEFRLVVQGDESGVFFE